jgi:hypothetical protein
MRRFLEELKNLEAKLKNIQRHTFLPLISCKKIKRSLKIQQSELPDDYVIERIRQICNECEEIDCKYICKQHKMKAKINEIFFRYG